MLMASVEPALGHAMNCEVRKYDREQLLAENLNPFWAGNRS
jgi:hypothetical protein